MKRIIAVILLTIIFVISIFADAHTYLNFTAVGGQATIKLAKNGSPATISLVYSTDSCATWNTYAIDQVIPLAENQRVYLKADSFNSSFSTSTSNYYKFVMTGKISAGGSVMSLLDERLPDSINSKYAFNQLFYNCASLIHTPLLPATSLAEYCYYDMFSGCTSLKNAPVLPATSLPPYCYSYMFSRCSSLLIDTVPPGVRWQIPADARKVSEWNWNWNMFWATGGEFSGSPEIGRIYYVASDVYKVTAIGNDTAMGDITGMGIYSNGDTAILVANARPTCKFTHWSNGDTSNVISVVVESDTILTAYFELKPTARYVLGVTNDTTMGYVEGCGAYFVADTAMLVAVPNKCYRFVGWSNGDTSATISVSVVSDTTMIANFEIDTAYIRKNYLHFTAMDNAGTIALNADGTPTAVSLVYSLDDCATWNTYTIGQVIPIAENQKVYFRADSANSRFSTGLYDYYHFVMTGTISAGGSVMSLLDASLPESINSDYAFNSLFSGCSSLVNAPQLPATTLAPYCYYRMFSVCNSLKSIPSLPVTRTAQKCYSSMFSSCISLRVDTVPPGTQWQIPADVEDASDWNRNMFAWTSGTFTGDPIPGTIYYITSDTRRVVAESSDSTKGSVSGYGDYYVGDTVTLTAEPNRFSLLKQWSNGDTTNVTMVVVESDTTLTAYFDYKPTARSVSVLVNDTALGSVTGGGWYFIQDTITLTAKPRNRYCRFEGWSNGDTSKTISFVLVNDTSFAAIFELDSAKIRANTLNFKAVGDSTKIYLQQNRYPSDISLQYSVDNCVTWNNYMIGKFITLQEGEKIYFRATTKNIHFSTSASEYYRFGTFGLGKVEANGSIMSLLDGTLAVDSVPAYTFSNLFSDNWWLIKAPELPATVVGDYGYYEMFRECIRLTQPPALPATELGRLCYDGMFKDCSSLVRIPSLPARELKDACYGSMFEGCTALHVDTTPRGVPWMIPADAAQISPVSIVWNSNMFAGTGGTFTGNPEPGTTYYVSSDSIEVSVNYDATKGMVTGAGKYFYGDSATLSAIPYKYRVFSHWSNGDTSRVITLRTEKDTSLVAYFEIDSQARYVTTIVNDTSLGYAIGEGYHYLGDTVTLTATPYKYTIFRGWSNGDTAKSISFVLSSDTTVTAIFELDTVFYLSDILNFTAVDGAATVMLIAYGKQDHVSLEYSTDGCVTWNAYSFLQIIQLMQGEKVYFRATTNNSTFCSSVNNDYFNFAMTGRVSANGNVMSLLDSRMLQDSVPEGAFYRLFEGCVSLIHAPELPAKVTGKVCYMYMFAGCTSLFRLPKLPADLITESCYEKMFYNCTSLIVDTVPPGTHWSIPANATAATNWNRDMFLDTRGAFTGDPVIGHQYYVVSDKQTVVLECNGPDMGKVYGAGLYYIGDTVTLTATPHKCYNFTGWSNGDTSRVITIVVEHDTVLTANFVLDTRARYVSATANNPNLGYIAGGGYHYIQDTVTLVAVAKRYGRFLDWSDGCMQKSISFIIENDTAIAANFELDSVLRSSDILHFTAVCPSTIKLNCASNQTPPDLEYSTDSCMTWNSYAINQTITLLDDERVYFKATSTNASMKGCKFVITGGVYGGGNIMSLLDAEMFQDSVPDSAFIELFYNCSSLLSTPELPATRLSSHCYQSMFYGCSSLSSAPKLPAMIMADHCYASMFENCHQLTRIPQLPATVLAASCYSGMFYRCFWLKVDTMPPGTPWMIPSEAVHVAGCNWFMFGTTGGSFTSSPIIGTTYYIESDRFSVSVNVNDPELGYVDGCTGPYATYIMGDTVTLTAIPYEWSKFVRWSNGDTSRVINIRVEGDTVLTAIFASNDDLKAVAVDSDNPSWGYVTGEGYYLINDVATLTAVPRKYTRFKMWSNGDTTATITVNVVSDTSFVAYFELDSARYAQDVLNFTAVGGPATIKLELVGPESQVDLQYSVDGCRSWSDYNIGQEISLPSRTKVYFKATTVNYRFSIDEDCFYNFVMTGSVKASGSIMSLLDEMIEMWYVPENSFLQLFDDCHSLIQAPELPSDYLSDGCYDKMFRNCIALTRAPILPAMSLGEKCYESMFEGCISLTQAPSLPALNMAYRCYYSMFKNCLALKKSPELPATTLARYCYYNMFTGCAALTNLPELPATDLEVGCYYAMFKNCGSLKISSVQPGTPWQIPEDAIVENGWNSNMFNGTSGSFTGNPSVGTTYYILSDLFYVAAESNSDMMGDANGTGYYNKGDSVTLSATPKQGCHFSHWSNGETTDVISVNVMGDTVLYAFFEPNINAMCVSEATNNSWMGTVSGGGYYYVGDTATLTATSRPGSYFSHWDDGDTSSVISFEVESDTIRKAFFMRSPVISSYNIPLNFTALNDTASIALVNSYADDEVDLQYSLDECDTWQQYTIGQRIVLAEDEKVYFKATSENDCFDGYNFVMTGRLAGDGNIMSMLDAKMSIDSVPGNAFTFLFADCSSLVTAPALPAYALSDFCYSWMFAGCTSLETPPALPAAEMKKNCYRSMFSNCSSLSSAPELPSVLLDYNCYGEMFAYCTSLTEAPELPATTLADICYGSMFVGCTSLMSIPDLPAEDLAYRCYEYMFKGCTSLYVSTNGPGKKWRIPDDAIYAERWNNQMFAMTSGSFTGDPEIGVTYYLSFDTIHSDIGDVADNQIAVTLFPNPIGIGDNAFVRVPDDATHIDVFTFNGILVKTIKVTSSIMSVGSFNTAGVYFIRITNYAGKLETKKLIVR